MLVTNWMLSSGVRIDAGASASAAKLINEKMMKMTIPHNHSFDLCGFDLSSSGSSSRAVACMFWPTLMPIEPATPIRTPTPKPHAGSAWHLRPGSNKTASSTKVALSRVSLYKLTLPQVALFVALSAGGARGGVSCGCGGEGGGGEGGGDGGGGDGGGNEKFCVATTCTSPNVTLRRSSPRRMRPRIENSGLPVPKPSGCLFPFSGRRGVRTFFQKY